MSFDKAKAMKNAEKYLSQGKFRAVINEYERIIEHDSNDFGTLNMLGDLYVKVSEKDKAVKCFTQVGEHYANLGFAQKAIAVYNKISRLMPDSLDVSAKLAQLYQMKGSIVEARTHYTALAEEYTRTGKKNEAIKIWKEIGNLDPTNADIFLKIAESCKTEMQFEEAAGAYTEAGKRYSAKQQFESASLAFKRALEINKDNFSALSGLTEVSSKIGYAEDALDYLEEAAEHQPHNKELVRLLIDCSLKGNKPALAEKYTVKLIEQEPSNYLKLLEVIDLYLQENRPSAASACLARISENLLLGGQFTELESYIEKILVKDPEDITGLRLMMRFRDWQRNDDAIIETLERMSYAARQNNLPVDEYNALERLAKYKKGDAEIAERLRELADYAPQESEFSEEFTSQTEDPFVDSAVIADNSSLIVRDTVQENEFAAMPAQSETNQSEQSELSENANDARNFGEIVSSQNFGEISLQNYQDSASVNSLEENTQNGFEYFQTPSVQNEFENTADKSGEISESNFGENTQTEFEVENFLPQEKSVVNSQPKSEKLSEAKLYALRQELESIDFYIEQGYTDLAEKALDDIESRFGKHITIDKYRLKISPDADIRSEAEPVSAGETDAVETEVSIFSPEKKSENSAVEETKFDESDESIHITGFDDFKSELGLDDSEVGTVEDFETVYQTGIAYKEMGLLEESIKELQKAANMTAPDDGTRNFFSACNLLGHTFMEKNMPGLALIWYKRALEQENLKKEEITGLQYEIANAYEQSDNKGKAIEYFERIYADNVDYRDIEKRLNMLKNS